MDESTFGQLLVANWMLVTIVSAALLVLAVALLVRRRRRFRRMPTTIGGVGSSLKVPWLMRIS